MKQHFGYNINRTSSYQSMGLPLDEDREPRVPKYTLICQKCGAQIHRSRRCKVTENPRNYRCGKCGGKLKLMSESTTSCR